MTKLTWDNAALVSPGDAETLGVRRRRPRHGDSRPGSDEIVGHDPGLRPARAGGRYVTLAAGYGRTDGGPRRRRRRARTSTRCSPASRRRCRSRRPTGDTDLATTQNHHAIDEWAGRRWQKRMHHLIRAGDARGVQEAPRVREARPSTTRRSSRSGRSTTTRAASGG